MAEYQTTYNKGGQDWNFGISVTNDDNWSVCATPTLGGSTLCSILGQSTSNTALIPSARSYINQSLLREGYPKKLIVVGDSIWDKNSYNINAIILSTMQQLGVDIVYMNVQASMSSSEWVAGTTPQTMQDAINNCVGEDGADTLVMMALGINDIDYEIQVYDWDTDFAQQKILLKSNIDLFIAAKPKIKMFWVSAPASGIQSFNENYERMICEIASEQGYPWYSGYQALKGVRPSYQNTDSRSAFFNDGIHPNQIGLMRFWYYLIMKIGPVYYYKELALTQFANPAASPDDQPRYSPIQGSAYTNTVVNNQLTLTSTANHYRFTQMEVIPGQLISLKMPDISLMGDFQLEVKWVMTTGNILYDNNPVDLPPLATGETEYIITAPDNVRYLCVNISNNNAFWTAYQSDNTICHLKMAYSRTTYEAPIEDILMGFPQTIFDYSKTL